MQGVALWPLGGEEAHDWAEARAALREELEASLAAEPPEPADWLRSVLQVLGSVSAAPESRAEALELLRERLAAALPLCGRGALRWETRRRVGSAIDWLLASPAEMRLSGFLPERWAPQGYQPRACPHAPHVEPPKSIFLIKSETTTPEAGAHAEPAKAHSAASDPALRAPPEAIRGVRFDPSLAVALPEEGLHAPTVERGLDWMALCATHRLSLPRSAAPDEQERFLQLLDGVLVLGPEVLPWVQQWWEANADSPDAWKILAPCFLLASLEDQEAPPMLGRILSGLSGESAAQVVAAARGVALARGSGAEWVGNQLAVASAPVARAVGIASLSLRGKATPQQVLACLADPHPLVLEQALSALGRLREAPLPVESLRGCLQHPCGRVVLAAARALLLHGDREPMRAAREGSLGGAGSCLLEVCALAGTASERPVVEQHLGSAPVGAQGLASLGELGDIAFVPVLLDALADEELLEAADRALQLIFGEQPLAEGVNADEPASWKSWFDASAFNPDERYRLGVPYSARSLGLEYQRGEASYLQLSRRLVELSIRCRVRVDAPLCGWNQANEAAMGAALAAARGVSLSAART